MKANLLLIAATLILAFSACNKVSEEIKRDVIIRPDSIGFSIPPMTVNGDSIVIDNLPTTVNIADSIQRLGGESFSVNDITDARLSNFSIDQVLSKNDTINRRTNLSSISYIKANLNNGTKRDDLAKVINNSSQDAFTTKLVLSNAIDNALLKTYLSNGALRYTLIIKPRKSTIDTIKAKIAASYTLTLRK